MTITVNPFVCRQKANSRFSHTNLTDTELCALIEAHFGQAKPGYREGVLLIPVPPDGFFSGTVELKEGVPLRASFEKRRAGEEPRLHVGLDVDDYLAAKQAAVAVDIVLYASKVLAEDQSNSLPPEEGNWEVVSINARLCEGEEPMHPSTLMANHFGESGGTLTGMTDSQFVAALRKSRSYWKSKISLG